MAIPRPLADVWREPSTNHGADVALDALVREWLLELKVMGRSQRTMDWYAQKMRSYVASANATRLDELTAFAVKRYLGELRDRGLAPNTIHGVFETLKALASWAQREHYPVDADLLRMRAPQVPVKEMETYSSEQLNTLFAATPPGWATLAIQILLGTGMRLAELCALTVDDVEDEGEVTFLKIRSGKGAKFRRVPISSRLRRELVRLSEPLASRYSRSSSARPLRFSAGECAHAVGALPSHPTPRRLRCSSAQIPPYIRDRVPAPGWGDRAPAPHPWPHHLCDGHALCPPRQGQSG